MLHLLIVEDEETMREGLAAMIDWETLGIRLVGAAANGLEALKIIEKEAVDLLLTDIRMPLMDGLQLIGEVRRRGRDTACVLLSGYNDFEYAQQALRYGVSDFLVKPCSPREIRSVFADLAAKILEQRRRSDSVKGLHESMPVIKSQLLRHWLHSPALVTENRKEQLKKLKLSISDQHPIVVAIQIDNRSRQRLNYSRTDLELIRLAAANIVQETLEQSVMQPVETVKEEDGIIVILNGLFEWIEEKLVRGLARVQHNLRQYLKITVSFGISDSKPDINDLAEAYSEARQALELRFYRGSESHAFYRDVRALAKRAGGSDGGGGESGFELKLLRIEQSAVDNLQAGLYAEALNDAEQWLAAFQGQYPHSRTEINVRTLSFLARLLQLAPDRLAAAEARMEDSRTGAGAEAERSKANARADGGANARADDGANAPFAETEALGRDGDSSADYGSLERQLAGIDTMEELAGFVYRVIRKLVEKLNPHRTPRRKVQQALDYIAHNFNAPGLSLAGVAKELFVSSTYLSTLFKQELGVNFLDYVHQYRVDKAKGLLQSADYKIQAVAKEVGYFDEAHFTRTFKKWTGILPSQYKKENAHRG